jgi:hypothetical protein
MLSYFHDGRRHVQTYIHTNRLLVAHDAGATATVISSRLPFRTGPSALAKLLGISSSAASFDGRTRQQSHFFQHGRSVRLAYTEYVGKARIKSYLDYILSGCTQNSLVPAERTAAPRQTPALAPNKLDPSVRVLLSLWGTLTAGATFDYT